MCWCTCVLSILPQLETKGLNTSSFQPQFRATFLFKKKKRKKKKPFPQPKCLWSSKRLPALLGPDLFLLRKVSLGALPQVAARSRPLGTPLAQEGHLSLKRTGLFLHSFRDLHFVSFNLRSVNPQTRLIPHVLASGAPWQRFGMGWRGLLVFIYLFKCLCNSNREENLENQRESE